MGRVVHTTGGRLVFILIALICFVLALFHVNLAGIDLVILGWIFFALHFLFGNRVWSP